MGNWGWGFSFFVSTSVFDNCFSRFFAFLVLFVVSLMKYPFVDTAGIPRLVVKFEFEPVMF